MTVSWNDFKLWIDRELRRYLVGPIDLALAETPQFHWSLPAGESPGAWVIRFHPSVLEIAAPLFIEQLVNPVGNVPTFFTVWCKEIGEGVYRCKVADAATTGSWNTWDIFYDYVVVLYGGGCGLGLTEKEAYQDALRVVGRMFDER